MTTTETPLKVYTHIAWTVWDRCFLPRLVGCYLDEETARKAAEQAKPDAKGVIEVQQTITTTTRWTA